MLSNFKKIFFWLSPTYRLIKGDEARLISLIDRVERLQRAVCDGTIRATDRDYDKNLFGEEIDIILHNSSRITRYQCTITEFFQKMNKFILKTKVIVDVGCGIHPQTFFAPKVHICIEPFAQYRDIVKPFFPNRCHFIFLRGDALSSVRTLDDNSVDTVFMIDLIEHLEKQDGINLLKEADRVARKQVIVFTPLGFYPMHFKEDGQKDAWGLDGNDVQEHKSGWLPEDFGDEWNFHICENCHEAFLPEEKAAGKKYSALMAIKTKQFDGFDVMEKTPQFVKDIHAERVMMDKNK